MHVNTFDRYESRQSAIHRLDPRVKVVVTVLFIVANALLPDGAWLAFSTDAGGVADVWLAEVASGEMQQATQDANARYPLWLAVRER